MKIRATVAYDGTDFFGFQKQANARTVQGEIEAALERICRAPVAVTGAGRTDAGVHATGQVIAFDATWGHAVEALVRALNAEVPDDVAVRDAQVCPDGFHSRFDARSRTYEYSAYVDEVRQPLRRRYAWRLDEAPDVAEMNAAARQLVGKHDFAAFGSAPSGRADETTVRVVLRAEWRETADGLSFVIEANAFLYRMVRRVVLALVQVGLGRMSAAELSDALESMDAGRIKGLAPACGLCLVDVKY